MESHKDLSIDDSSYTALIGSVKDLFVIYRKDNTESEWVKFEESEYEWLDLYPPYDNMDSLIEALAYSLRESLFDNNEDQCAYRISFKDRKHEDVYIRYRKEFFVKNNGNPVYILRILTDADMSFLNKVGFEGDNVNVLYLLADTLEELQFVNDKLKSSDFKIKWSDGKLYLE